MKLALSREWAIVGFLSIILLFSAYSVYTKDIQITLLNKKAGSLNALMEKRLEEKDLETQTLVDNFEIVRMACLQETGCRDLYGENLRLYVLSENNITGAKRLKRVSVNAVKTPEFGEKLDEFIALNCPPYAFGPLGTLYSVSTYNYSTKTIGFLTDEEGAMIKCAWVHDPATDEYVPF